MGKETKLGLLILPGLVVVVQKKSVYYVAIDQTAQGQQLARHGNIKNRECHYNE